MFTQRNVAHILAVHRSYSNPLMGFTFFTAAKEKSFTQALERYKFPKFNEVRHN